MGVYLNPNIVPSFVKLVPIVFTARIYLSIKNQYKGDKFYYRFGKNTFYIYSYTFILFYL